MNLRTYSLTVGETINMGNFNNVRYEVAGSIELAEGDDVEAACNELREWVRGKAREHRAAIKGTQQQ